MRSGLRIGICKIMKALIKWIVCQPDEQKLKSLFFYYMHPKKSAIYESKY
jgi:hypothetical protein